MPRFVPATVTELSRVTLLAGLPGERLAEIARRMEREEVPPGRAVVREGDDVAIVACGVTVGEGSVIASHALVNRDVPPLSIADVR